MENYDCRPKCLFLCFIRIRNGPNEHIIPIRDFAVSPRNLAREVADDRFMKLAINLQELEKMLAIVPDVVQNHVRGHPIVVKPLHGDILLLTTEDLVYWIDGEQGKGLWVFEVKAMASDAEGKINVPI